MIDKIPSDVIYLICKNLSFTDIISLRRTNSKLLHSTTDVSDYLFTSELLKMDYPIYKNEVYLLINELLQNKYFEAKTRIFHNLHRSDELFVRQYIYNNIDKYSISIYENINNVFYDLFSYYIMHGDISNYQNKYLIFIFYNLLQITFFRNIKNVKYNIDFLIDFYERNNKSIACYNLIYEYSYFLITNHIALHFESQYIISKFITSIHCLKKLIGVKQLNLKNTTLISCCPELDIINLKEIVIYRYNIQDDDLIAFNYNEIKKFVQLYSSEFYNLMIEYELCLINNHVIYRHPFNRNHMRLNSKASHRLLYKLRYEMIKTNSNIKLYQNLEKYITRKQQELLDIFFY